MKSYSVSRLKRFKFREFLFLSLLLHFLVAILFFYYSTFPRTASIVKAEPIDVYIADEEYRMQIVSIDEVEADDTDVKTRFLSEVDRRVERETRAREWGKPYNVRQRKLERIIYDELDRAIDQYLESKVKREDSEQRSSATYDYLPDIGAGDFTALSTAEFTYYSFYRRIEDAVVYLWNYYVSDYIRQRPEIASALRNRDYITEVEAVLDVDGNFIRMIVVRSSGVAGLDDAPGMAFASATPFENPPKGMIGDDGYIRMRWRFIVGIVEQVRFNIQHLDYDYYRRLGYPDPSFRR